MTTTTAKDGNATGDHDMNPSDQSTRNLANGMTALRKACEDFLYAVDGDMRHNNARGVLRTLRYESHPDIADAIIDESELTDADIAAILVELAAIQTELEETESPLEKLISRVSPEEKKAMDEHLWRVAALLEERLSSIPFHQEQVRLFGKKHWRQLSGSFWNLCD